MPQYFVPTVITQYAEYPDQNISWTNNIRDKTVIDQLDYNLANPDTGAGDKNIITTIKPLQHIPNSSRGAILDKTYYLKCLFDMTSLPEEITGFTVEIHAQRNGRVVDDTVAFILNDQVISENKTNLSTREYGHIRNNNIQIYGGEFDKWGMEITQDMALDPSFGLLLRFGSNPMYPHRDGMQIYKILLTVHPYTYFIFEANDNITFELENDSTTIFVPE